MYTTNVVFDVHLLNPSCSVQQLFCVLLNLFFIDFRIDCERTMFVS